jgi:Holliday junction resolvase RusA-like endonuclease
MTQRDKWKKRPAVMRYRAFCDKVRWLRITLPQPCRVVFYLPMPGSWTAARKLEADGEPHTVRPDLDNLVKALFDAVCHEDAHLWKVQAEKRWGLVPGIDVEAPP